MKSDLYVRIQSEPKQGFCFDCLAVRERNQPRRRLPEDFEQVLHRPIETARLLRHWRELRRDAGSDDYFWIANHPTSTQHESNKSRRIGSRDYQPIRPIR